jgi:hypothetical protein
MRIKLTAHSDRIAALATVIPACHPREGGEGIHLVLRGSLRPCSVLHTPTNEIRHRVRQARGRHGVPACLDARFPGHKRQ